MIFVYHHVMTDMWRLLDSGQLPTAESAAVDEAVLESHADGAVPNTLHFYARSQPTVSLGRFQKVAEAVDIGECSRRGVALVRRSSGGGSIYTDPGQLIYAAVLPVSEIGSDAKASFAPICSAVARGVGRFGLDARHRPINDVEVDGRKISGSAQLRRRGSLLQHGTVLIDADIDAMEAVLKPSPSRPTDRVTTLSRLMPVPPDAAAVKAAIVEELGRHFDVGFKKGSLTDVERARVLGLVRTRYGRKEWNMRL